MEILDTTLREGEQCYGVFFPLEVKKQIALLLNKIGVDFIEAGHPAAAPSIRQAVSELAKLDLDSRILAHARLDKDEIRLVKDLGVQWVGLFCGINDKSLRRYNLTRRAIHEKTTDAVLYAKESGLSIKFTCEDASRTDTPDLIDFYSHLASLGVDRLSFADTLGIMRPEDIERAYARINRHVAFNRLHFHFHNDFGFARKNAIKAIELGARCVDTSISGIGERMGIVALEHVIAFSDDDFRAEAVREAVNLVRSCINYEHFRDRRFAHKSGIHINGILKDPPNYEPVAPDHIGGRRILVLSKLIGKSGLRTILSRSGFNNDNDEDTSFMLEQIKSDELLELADPEDIMHYLEKRGWRGRVAAS